MEIIPYIFTLIPSELCQTHIMEHYILQWSDISTMKEVFSYQLKLLENDLSNKL